MQAHHYLGALPKIGETLWYVARWRRENKLVVAADVRRRIEFLRPTPIRKLTNFSTAPG